MTRRTARTARQERRAREGQPVRLPCGCLEPCRVGRSLPYHPAENERQRAANTAVLAHQAITRERELRMGGT